MHTMNLKFILLIDCVNLMVVNVISDNNTLALFDQLSG